MSVVFVIVTEYAPDYRPEFAGVYGPYGSREEAIEALRNQGWTPPSANDVGEWTRPGPEALDGVSGWAHVYELCPLGDPKPGKGTEP